LKGVAVGAYWIGVPLVILLALVLPRDVVIYTGGDTPTIERPPSPFSDRIADILYSYRASALAVLIAAATTFVGSKRRNSLRFAPPSLAACFLPTYVAGIESTDHLRWAMRCHSTSGDFNLAADLLGRATTCAFALAITIGVGVVTAVAFGHRSRFGIPMHPVVGAILAGAALPWLLVLYLVN
jgi:hypothetical protein